MKYVIVAALLVWFVWTAAGMLSKIDGHRRASRIEDVLK